MGRLTFPYGMPDEEEVDTRPWERLHELLQAGDAQAIGVFIESLAVAEAVRGASVQVPTLGAPVKMVIPPGTQTGRTLRVKGKGIERRGRPAGDLYVDVQVRVPEQLDEETLAAIEEAYDRDIRETLLRTAAA